MQSALIARWLDLNGLTCHPRMIQNMCTSSTNVKYEAAPTTSSTLHHKEYIGITLHEPAGTSPAGHKLCCLRIC